MAKTRIITPVNASPDGFYHSANGRVKRVYDTNGMGQLVQVPFDHLYVKGDMRDDRSVVQPQYAPVGQIYLECKIGQS